MNVASAHAPNGPGGLRCAALAGVACVALAISACRPLPPRDATWPDADTDHEQTNVTEQAPTPTVSVPNGCPFLLRNADGHETRVTYATPDDVDAQLRVFTGGVFDDGGVVVRHELRDRRGLESGHATYRCDPQGLALASLITAEQSLTFTPPVLVYPVTATSLVSVGTATSNGAPLSYTHTLSARAVAPLLELDADNGPWVEAAYVLELHDEDATALARWEGTSTWTVLYGVPVPARRALRVTDGAATVNVTEVATTILP